MFIPIHSIIIGWLYVSKLSTVMLLSTISNWRCGRDGRGGGIAKQEKYSSYNPGQKSTRHSALIIEFYAGLYSFCSKYGPLECISLQEANTTWSLRYHNITSSRNAMFRWLIQITESMQLRIICGVFHAFNVNGNENKPRSSSMKQIRNRTRKVWRFLSYILYGM